MTSCMLHYLNVIFKIFIVTISIVTVSLQNAQSNKMKIFKVVLFETTVLSTICVQDETVDTFVYLPTKRCSMLVDNIINLKNNITS